MRWRIIIGGRVQGVGFRPFVARLAGGLGLAGLVGNDVHGVFIEVQGAAAALAEFRRRLESEAPPLARIGSLTVAELAEVDTPGFAIADSQAGTAPTLAITPDAAVCAACAAEVRDPADRRHGYPFANCTDCGPRYAIITAVPYDRAATTMAGFAMCATCQAEFDDVRDRRYHAQPIACPVCGPRAWLHGFTGDGIREAGRLLHAGGIVAVKGLGGFHLAVRADDAAAVERLRARKHRDAKPFAVMVRDLLMARELAELISDDELRLQSPAAPIVLARRRLGTPLAAAVAPGSDLVGVMLPYTPLHLLLLAAGPPLLVMTSGNPAGEPLCHDNAEALERLAGIADAFLLHDRPIARPLDDSVWLGGTPLRRARGHVPDPIALPGQRSVLALGGDLKAVVALAEGGRCVLSEHLGDLENPAAFRNFADAISRLQELLRIRPQAVAIDRHPGYHGARFGRSLGLPVVAVQHHHAHAAACLAEHGHTGPALAVVCDGTGYGDDGTIWGGEILRLEGARCQRLDHLAPLALIGGDAGASETWRPAVGLLARAYGTDWPRHQPRPLDPETVGIAAARLPRAVACSSLGRLFDGVAWLLGLCDANRFEGEAAIAVEQAAYAGRASVPLAFDGLDPAPLVRALCASRLPPADLALAFHEAVCDAFTAAVLRHRGSVEVVALSGGCFANRLLLKGMQARLEAAGMRVLTHRLVPPGDGGLALGQAAVAAIANPDQVLA